MSSAAIRGRRANGLEHARDGADVRRDAHAVVVEDHDDAALVVTDVVQTLECHSGRERSVADDGDDVEVVVPQIARERHPMRRGDRGARVPGAELVVLGLRTYEESRDPSELAKRIEALTTTGEHLVHVRLVAGVPHDLVAGRLEHAMQRDAELDRAEARRYVSPGLLHALHRVLADLPTKFQELVLMKGAQVAWMVHALEDAHVAILRARAGPFVSRVRRHRGHGQPRSGRGPRVSRAGRARRDRGP